MAVYKGKDLVAGSANIDDDAVSEGSTWSSQKIKNELENNNELPTASTTVKGGVKVDGTSTTVDENGVLHAAGGGGSYTLPAATASALGGVKSGGDISVASDGSVTVNKVNGETLSAVATSNDYNDLDNKPAIPTIPTNVSAFTNDAGYLTEHQDISGKANIADLSAVATSGSYDDLDDKPEIPAPYTLPKASTSTLGGVKVDGTTVTINDDGVISAIGVSQAYRIMTVKIDLSNSNPATCCTYADDAAGMTAGSDEWEEFFGVYPVLLKNGSEVGELNPNNFAQFANGTAADITSGNAGDVMICFPGAA